MVENHRDFGPSYYCNAHNATFEAQEAERNNLQCPWCDYPVAELLQ